MGTNVSRKKKRKKLYITLAILIIPIIYLGFILAPYIEEQGLLFGVYYGVMQGLRHPLQITLCDMTLEVVLISAGAYAFIAVVYAMTAKNYRKGEEQGSADWGEAKKINANYEQKPWQANKVMTRNISIGLNSKEHRKNLMTTVVGGSGAGKTFSYVKPNLIQGAFTQPASGGNGVKGVSYVVTDPKGELLRDCGGFLEQQGYKIKVLDLLHMPKSHRYNPFRYLTTENEVQQLCTNLFKATTPKGTSSSDPFWDNASELYLLALTFFLLETAPIEDQNFAKVLELIRIDQVADEEEQNVEESPVQTWMSELEHQNPNSLAVKYYKEFRAAAGKTLKSIQITLISHLEKFNLSELASMTSFDEMELDQLGQEKMVIFALIPDNDTSFNFLVSILYTQLFQRLFRVADDKYGGGLPYYVHFMMDEFANIALPDDFPKILSVMRSRNVFVSIILQNLAQLKTLFEKEWEGILGNCDEFLYLGGNEQTTHKYVSELLGKQTIDMNTYGHSHGQHGSYSTNYQIQGRELLTPDEVRMLDNDYALLFIRGERPVADLKYDVRKHPNAKYSADGGAPTYEHGKTPRAVTDLTVRTTQKIGSWTIKGGRIDADMSTKTVKILFDQGIGIELRKQLEKAGFEQNTTSVNLWQSPLCRETYENMDTIEQLYPKNSTPSEKWDETLTGHITIECYDTEGNEIEASQKFKERLFSNIKKEISNCIQWSKKSTT